MIAHRRRHLGIGEACGECVCLAGLERIGQLLTDAVVVVVVNVRNLPTVGIIEVTPGIRPDRRRSRLAGQLIGISEYA